MDTKTHTFLLEPQTSEPPAALQDPRPDPTVPSRITLAVFGAIALILGLIAVDIALMNGIQPTTPRPVMQMINVSGAPAVQPVVYLSVAPGVKPGPDGQLHDAFSVTDFTVHAGQPVKLVISNTDEVAHSINSPGAGVNIIVRPGTHTYTLIVHSKGSFEWFCGMPCDPYSMSHFGYMRGRIVST